MEYEDAGFLDIDTTHPLAFLGLINELSQTKEVASVIMMDGEPAIYLKTTENSYLMSLRDAWIFVMILPNQSMCSAAIEDCIDDLCRSKSLPHPKDLPEFKGFQKPVPGGKLGG